MAATPKTAAARELFIQWEALSDSQRRALKLPTSDAAWAHANGVADRTVRGWRKNPEVAERVAALRASAGFGPVASQTQVLAAGPGGPTMAAGAIDVAMEKIAVLIEEGDKEAIKMLITSPQGRKYLEAQLEASRSDFSHLSDEELVGRTLALASDEELAAVLSARGWVVSRGE